MRTILMLRGAQGCGKSTFVRNNNLEAFTISTDSIRHLYGGAVVNEFGDFTTSGSHNKAVFELIEQLLEYRMQRGTFIVYDACNAKLKDTELVHKLASKYRYRVLYYQFDTPLEECIKNNEKRLGTYGYVPVEAIKKYHQIIQEVELPKSKFTRVYSLDEAINLVPTQFDDTIYSKMIVIGDVHACNTALNELISKEFVKDNKDRLPLLVFVGDYIDRGIENAEALNTISNLVENYPRNVILLEGNHETHLRDYIDKATEFRSNEFINFTKPQLDKASENDDTFKKRVNMNIVRRLRQVHYTSFNDKNNSKVFITHGGIPRVFESGMVAKYSSKDFIKGVGAYSTDISKIFNENHKEDSIYQIHGHRSMPMDYEKSISLETSVEFGGTLSYAIVSVDNGDLKIEKRGIQNSIFKVDNGEGLHLTTNGKVNKIILDPYINTKRFDEAGIISLNFNREAFRRGMWTPKTTTARGLFCNAETGEVVLRSYNKFFNYGENSMSDFEHLKKTLKFPLDVYKKHNGFLGLLSVHNDEFVFASKSSINSTHSTFFKNIFNRLGEEIKSRLKKFIKDNNVTILYEVCDTANDPHIIHYEKPLLYFLDVIPNHLEVGYSCHKDISKVRNLNEMYVDLLHKYAGEDYKNSIELYKVFSDIRGKERMLLIGEPLVLYNMGQFESYVNKVANDKCTTTQYEGVVIEDANGFMIKVKTDYYNKVKECRSIFEQIQRMLIDTSKPQSVRDKIYTLFEEFLNKHFNSLLLEHKVNGDEFIHIKDFTKIAMDMYINYDEVKKFEKSIKDIHK